MNCEICGQQVKIVGKTTKHYAPAVNVDALQFTIKEQQERIQELEEKIAKICKVLKDEREINK